MQTQLIDRKRNAILGAAVADAASLGFHWLYDQSRILSLEPATPEFRTPTENDYSGVAGYFAHAQKHRGDFSQYGVQLMVMLQSLSESSGRYSKFHYESTFLETFGYGGTYVGYIDHPTRDTLNNHAKAENDAIARAEGLAFKSDDMLKRKLIAKVLASIKSGATGDALEKEIEASVRATDDDDYLVAHAKNMAKELNAVSGYHGADDQQLPAISKLPPLIAACCDAENLHELIESAVRVTNNNEVAVNAGLMTANLLKAVINAQPNESPENILNNAIVTARIGTAPTIDALFQQAADMASKSNSDAVSSFGLACQLPSGIPGILHNLQSSTSYSESIRANIYAGGDSCGRSIMIGAVMGVIHGVGGPNGIPQDWLDTLSRKEELLELLETALA